MPRPEVRRRLIRGGVRSLLIESLLVAALLGGGYLLALILEGDQQQNPLLFDGDTIRVEAATEPVPEMIELSTTTLAPQEITVNVIGEVKSGGRLQVPANTPLVEGVLAAGGPIAWRASRGDVELVRINRNGSALRRTFRLDYGEDVSADKNPPLVDGDTVVVKQNGASVTTQVTLDASVPGGCARIPAGVAGSESLGGQIGPVTIQKA